LLRTWGFKEVDRQEAEGSRWKVRADTTEAAELTVDGLWSLLKETGSTQADGSPRLLIEQ